MFERFNEFASEYGIAIPIIQRDYVQGAEANFEKRDKFLKSIFDALRVFFNRLTANSV